MRKKGILLIAVPALVASFATGIFFNTGGDSPVSMHSTEPGAPDLTALYTRLDSQQQELDSLHTKLELFEKSLRKATEDSKAMQETLLGKIENIQIQPVSRAVRVNAYANQVPATVAATQTFDERIEQVRNEEFSQKNTIVAEKALDDFLYQFDNRLSALQELNCYQSGCIALVSHPTANAGERFLEEAAGSKDEIFANGFSVETQFGTNGQEITRLYINTL